MSYFEVLFHTFVFQFEKHSVMASRYSPMTLVLTGNERAAMTRLSP